MENIYLHAINANSRSYLSIQTQKILNSILSDDAILSLRLQKKFEYSYSFSGIDYISLCDYDKRKLAHKEDRLYNSFNSYIRHSLSIVLKKENIEAINPVVIPISTKNGKGYINMQRLGNFNNTNIRYTDMPDEVQVKNCVSLKEMTAITLPTHLLIHKFCRDTTNINEVEYEVDILSELLKHYGYNIPIYDIDTFKNLRDHDSVVEICEKVKALKKRR